MILDSDLIFTGSGKGSSGGIESGAQTDLPTTGTQASSNVIDLGVVLGLPSYANGGGARDIGIGDDPSLKLLATVVTAWDAGTDCYLVLKGAPDDGSGGVGSLTTMWTSPTFLLATLQVVGTQLANVDVPLAIAGQALPRFLKLYFVTSGSSNTTGTVEAGIVIDRFDQVKGTTGALSGYRAGVTVAN